MTAAALVSTVCYSVVASTPRHPHELWSEQFQHAAVIYDVFGNPFRTTAADVASQFSVVDSVQELAENVYQGRRLVSLAHLAQELEQAGCTDTDLLEHCRQPEHFRGCWLVDAVRGVPV